MSPEARRRAVREAIRRTTDPAQEEAEQLAWAEEQARQEYEEEREAELEQQRHDDAIEEMVGWFHDNFEDPQNQMPYDEDGGYRYPWGGPFDAAEEIHQAFEGEYRENWIEEAVKKVVRDGTWEWAPKSSGDFYEHPPPDETSTVSNVGVDSIAILVPRLLTRLEELDRRLDDIPTTPHQIGHNNPPDDIGLPPYSDEDRAQAKDAISVAREELQSADPDPARIERARVTLASISLKVLKWLGKKCDMALDEFLKAAAKGAGYGVGISVTAAGTFMVMKEVAEELGKVLPHIPQWPF